MQSLACQPACETSCSRLQPGSCSLQQPCVSLCSHVARRSRAVPAPCQHQLPDFHHGGVMKQGRYILHPVTATPNGSVRQRKDPKAFKNMDAMRAHLEGQGQAGFISGMINFISQSSFGAAGTKQGWWTPAGLYRKLVQGNTTSYRSRPGEVDLTPEDPADPQYSIITQRHQQLSPVLLLSRSDLRRMSQRYPQVLSMSAADIAARLVWLREALPGCNTILLVELYPQLFLSGIAEQKRQQVVTSVAKLRASLKGAPLASVIMCDPEILFMDLDHGLSEFRSLWDVDEQALADSEPQHLAQAVRTLCSTSKQQPASTKNGRR